MKRALVYSALAGVAASIVAAFLYQRDVPDSLDSPMAESVTTVPVSVSSPEWTLVAPSEEGNEDGVVASGTGPKLAPRSDTIEEYLRDVQQMQSESAGPSPLPSEAEEPLVLYDVDLTLWHASPAAKSVFANYAQTDQLDDKYFIEFDEGALDILEPGQRFLLPPINGQSHSVVVKAEESLMQGAVNWDLVDDRGNPAGNIARIDDAVEGIFFAAGGVYHLRVVNGVGWVADEATLTSFTKDDFADSGSQQ